MRSQGGLELTLRSVGAVPWSGRESGRRNVGETVDETIPGSCFLPARKSSKRDPVQGGFKPGPTEADMNKFINISTSDLNLVLIESTNCYQIFVEIIQSE